PQLPASSARSLEQSGMLFQPAFGCLVVGTDLFDFAPEPDRVVHLLQVRQLVQNQVVADEGRRLEEPPVQRNRPSPRAVAPNQPFFRSANRQASAPKPPRGMVTRAEPSGRSRST